MVMVPHLCMMKNFKTGVITAAALFSTIFMYAQPKDASVMIDKENRNAVMIVIEQPENITKDALRQRMERSGLKERERSGVVSYKGVTLSEISPDKVDIYTKVEKGPNNTSVVYMAVSRGYNNFTNTTVDSNITQNVKTFLQSFVKDANNHFADVEIGKQVNSVNNDEKAYQRLLNEQRDLQKKKANIENRLSEIQNELNVRMDGLNKKKSGVEDARLKRNNMNK
jgi:hypothetical protein